MTAIEVWLAPATRVGALHAHAGRGEESFSFTYADEYLARPGSYPIDPALPLMSGAFHIRGRLFGAFADSSPDRWGRTLVRRALAEAAAVSGETPRQPLESDFLLGVRDDLRQGALRYRLPGDLEGTWRAQAEDGIPVLAELGALLALADKVAADEADLSEIRRLVGAGSSLGGARPKAHVLLPGGGIGIAKFPSALHDEWNVMAWEKVTLDLAARCGITVPPSQRVGVAGHDILVVERFDRRDGTRVPYVSAMTMLETTDGERATYLDLAETVEQYSPHPERDLSELWRRCVFDVLVNNTDNHLRNHGFLRAHAGWTLSPAFDINPTPFVAAFATDIADPGDTGAGRDGLLTIALDIADYFRLPPSDARQVLSEMQAVVSGWAQVAANHGIAESERRRMASAFAVAD